MVRRCLVFSPHPGGTHHPPPPRARRIWAWQAKTLHRGRRTALSLRQRPRLDAPERLGKRVHRGRRGDAHVSRRAEARSGEHDDGAVPEQRPGERDVHVDAVLEAAQAVVRREAQPEVHGTRRVRAAAEDALPALLPRAPGEKVLYSNLGMALLGQALAAKAGTTYEKLLFERIVTPFLS